MTDPTIRRQREREAGERRERLRLAELAAQQQEALRERIKRRAHSLDNARPAGIEAEWSAFKAGLAQAKIANQQRMRLQNARRVIEELELSLNPPPQPEPEIVYVQSYEGSNRLGDSDFNPKLWAQPMRWR